jgi:hypothetical protein
VFADEVRLVLRLSAMGGSRWIVQNWEIKNVAPERNAPLPERERERASESGRAGEKGESERERERESEREREKCERERARERELCLSPSARDAHILGPSLAVSRERERALH